MTYDAFQFSILTCAIKVDKHYQIENSKEIVRIFECTATLKFNLVKNKYDLAVKPFKNIETNWSNRFITFNRYSLLLLLQLLFKILIKIHFYLFFHIYID